MFEEEQGRYETSVFRTFERAEPEVWDLGVTHVASARGKPLLARTDIFVTFVRIHPPLDVTPAEPPRRHAVIVGWPDEKDARMLLQQLLAEDAHLKFP